MDAGNHAVADTRERILRSTWALMEEGGNLEVRIADIAAAAGVSRQAVYLHFGKRPNLLLAAVQYRDATSPDAKRIGHAARVAPLPEALAGLVAAWFAHLPRIQPVAGLLSAASQLDADARAAWEDRMALLRRTIRALVERLADANLLKPDWTRETATDWIWHRLHPDGWRHLVVERGWDAADYTRRVARSLERELLA